MLNFNFSKDDITDIIGPYKGASKNNVIGKCPLCGKDNHFYINSKTFLWDCKKCGESGNLYRLLEHLNLIYKYVVKTINLNNLVILGNSVEEPEEEYTEPKDKKLPIGFKRVYNNNYLKERRFTKKDFYKYKVGVSDISSKFEDYVIFSIEENGKVKGFVSRCSLPKEVIKELDLPRYKNSKDTEFSKLLYGWEELNENVEVVILVEGLFDKKAVDDYLRLEEIDEVKCLVTFGKKISKHQITKILSRAYNLEKAILFYDLDAIKDTKKIALELKNFFPKVEIACLESGKDADESTEEEVINAIINTHDPVAFKYNKVHVYNLK